MNGVKLVQAQVPHAHPVNLHCKGLRAVARALALLGTSKTQSSNVNFATTLATTALTPTPVRTAPSPPKEPSVQPPTFAFVRLCTSTMESKTARVVIDRARTVRGNRPIAQLALRVPTGLCTTEHAAATSSITMMARISAARDATIPVQRVRPIRPAVCAMPPSSVH